MGAAPDLCLLLPSLCACALLASQTSISAAMTSLLLPVSFPGEHPADPPSGVGKWVGTEHVPRRQDFCVQHRPGSPGQEGGDGRKERQILGQVIFLPEPRFPSV